MSTLVYVSDFISFVFFLVLPFFSALGRFNVHMVSKHRDQKTGDVGVMVRRAKAALDARGILDCV